MPMAPADAESAAVAHDYQGLTVFAPGAMRLQPGMGLEDLAQLAFEALRGGDNTGGGGGDGSADSGALQ